MTEYTLLNEYGVYKNLDMTPHIPSIETLRNQEKSDQLIKDFSNRRFGGTPEEVYMYAIGILGRPLARVFMMRRFAFSDYEIDEIDQNLSPMRLIDFLPPEVVKAENNKIKRDALSIAIIVEREEEFIARSKLSTQYNLWGEIIDNIFEVKGIRLGASSKSRIQAEVEIRKQLANERFIPLKKRKGLFKRFITFLFSGSDKHPLISNYESTMGSDIILD